MSKKKPIAEIEAWIPPIQSAIKIGQDGARVQLDVGEEGLAEVLKLAAFGRAKVLRVAIYETTP